MTDLTETMELDATETEDEAILDTDAEAASAPARPRLPAYVSHF